MVREHSLLEASPSAGWRAVYRMMHVPQPRGGTA